MLLEARGSVRSIEFVPHHFGLKLVSMHMVLWTYDTESCLQ